MVLDPSLDLIAGWGAREIHRRVDESELGLPGFRRLVRFPCQTADARADGPLPLSAPPLRLASRRP